MVEKEKIIERVRKLMAMAADCSSPNEAAIAAKRARSVMDKYQISLGDIADKSEFGSESASKARSRVPLWEQTLVVDIANLNDCIARYDNAGRFVFHGFDVDAKVCKFMFFYLTENGKRTCKWFIQTNPLGCRNSFKLGYSVAVGEKIKKIIEARKAELKTSTGTSLVLVKKSLVENEFGEAKYRNDSYSKSLDYRSQLAGQVAGAGVNIVTGVEVDDRQSISAA